MYVRRGPLLGPIATLHYAKKQVNLNNKQVSWTVMKRKRKRKGGELLQPVLPVYGNKFPATADVWCCKSLHMTDFRGNG